VFNAIFNNFIYIVAVSFIICENLRLPQVTDKLNQIMLYLLHLERDSNSQR